MEMAMAVKTFDIEEGTVEGGIYKITVRSNRRVVKTIMENTMEEARRKLRAEGYQLVSWAEGNRIVVQSEE